MDRLLVAALPSLAPDEPLAAAAALHARARRHPPLLQVMLPAVERALAGRGGMEGSLEHAAVVELVRACRYVRRWGPELRLPACLRSDARLITPQIPPPNPTQVRRRCRRRRRCRFPLLPCCTGGQPRQ